MSEQCFVILKLELQSDQGKITFAKSSLLQGVLMENIRPEYAQKMHEMSMRPYSQCVVEQDGKVYWQIATLNSEAYEEIIVPLASDSFRKFTLKHCDWTVNIISRQVCKTLKKEWMRSFYQEESSRMLTISFHTPTSFKKDGGYAIFPELKNIYESLMLRYESILPEESFYDPDTLMQLVDNSSIVRYRLRSVTFPMEATRIPGFMGEITIRIKGPQTMVNFVKLLLTFGTFAGVGMKTAMGMGNMTYEERRKEQKKL